ncbi:MAG: hypothetical protein VW687_14150, partial [Curvibacter sp.]
MSYTTSTLRRRFLQLLGLTAASWGLAPQAARAQAANSAPDVLRIGYQKSAVNLVILKQQGILEKRFPNTRVSWIEFPAGPQLLEALSVGSLEFGLTGDSPPVFAQADKATLICDEPADARASRFGGSGRAYPCYTLERAIDLSFGRVTLHCDEEGPAYAARSGRSGRYHACYALGQITEFRFRGATITCDIDHGRDSTRLGISGGRYDCYA